MISLLCMATVDCEVASGIIRDYAGLTVKVIWMAIKLGI